MLTLLLIGCTGDPVPVTVLEGFGYRWDLFNHRLSFLEGALVEGGAELAVVGGTSTTGVEPELADTCDPEVCTEFPFEDSAEVSVDWGRLTGIGIGSGSAWVELRVDASGTTASADVPLDDPSGASVAVISGLVLDTDTPLPDDVVSCYNPAYGWHPRLLSVSLGSPVPNDTSATVPVTASFEAGNSLEEVRACIDGVREYATVLVRIEVAVLTGVSATPQSLDQSASYTYGTSTSPDEQPDPDPADRPLDGDPAAAVFGWSALEFQFHVDDPEDRGAYLRSLSFGADTTSVGGHATNYSPGTQLSAFDYAFTGVVQAISTPEGLIERGTVGDDLPAELDETGAPVVTTITLD